VDAPVGTGTVCAAMPTLRPLLIALTAVSLAAACGDAPFEEAEALDRAPVPADAPLEPSAAAEAAAPDADDAAAGAPAVAAEPVPDPFARPDWLGQRPLPLRPDGLGEILPTPPELADRRLATPAMLAPPPDEAFHAAVTAVPGEVVARSTWQPACPVALEDLRYVTVSFWGFDGGHHTGELLAHSTVADDLVSVFARLHEARFPLEEVRVTHPDELDAHPTGDGNNSGAFVCRPSVGSSSWSEHAHGKAIDLNPFHNPYLRGDVVVPELASAYLDRGHVRPGMIVDGDVVVRAFADVGWSWGGHWRSAKDWMHFSPSGR
jgi:hypothetical protein